MRQRQGSFGRRSARRLLPVGVLATALCVVSACSSSGSAAPSSSGASGASGATSSAGSSSTSSSTSSGAGQRAHVPLTVANGANNEHVPVVQISVGGGKPIKVVLDTGSVGLVVAADAVGSSATPTGQQFSTTYGGFALKGSIDSAAVKLLGGEGDFATPPVGIGAVTGQLTSFVTSVGASGILGIAPGPSGTDKPDLLSPLPSLPGSLGNGYTVDLKAGQLDFGTPSTTGNGIAEVGLTKASWSYPTGIPGYSKLVAATWTFGTASVTVPTLLDTGGRGGVYAKNLLANVPLPLPAGTAISMAFADKPVLQYTTGSSTDPAAALTPSAENMNTGLPAFENNRVGFDLKAGRIVIIPD